MPITPVREILKLADANNTSVIAFNCFDYNTVYSAIHAADEIGKPIMVMLDPRHDIRWKWTRPSVMAAIAREAAKGTRVPVGLHLDHCTDPEYIREAMRCGFNSVMYDGSMLSAEENVRNTRAIVEAAKEFDVDVEAELGHVGFADNMQDQNNVDLYTRPETAARFCEESGCTSLAVAIGSAHGFYKETPKLDLDRLAAINAATDVPLVLHGGSGIPVDQLEVAFRRGINKFNVGTEYLYLYYTTVQAYCTEGHPDIFDLPKKVQAALHDYLVKKLQLCTVTL